MSSGSMFGLVKKDMHVHTSLELQRPGWRCAKTYIHTYHHV